MKSGKYVKTVRQDLRSDLSQEREDIMTRAEGLAAGVVVGVIFALILCVVLFRFANKDKKIKTEYDERQKEIRGRGYTIGFYTMVALLAVESLWSMSGNSFPLPDYIMYFLTVIIGVTVVCVHSIWKGVYWGINNDPKRYIVIMIAAFVLNLIPVAGALTSGGVSLSDPVDTLPMLNVIVLIMLFIVGAELIIKSLIDRKSAEED